MLTIEEDSGTYTGVAHSHNGYYAKSTAGWAALQRQSLARVEDPVRIERGLDRVVHGRNGR